MNIRRVLVFKKFDGILDLDTKKVHLNFKSIGVPLEMYLEKKFFVDLLTDDEVYFLNEEVLS